MRINTNVASLNAQNQATQTNSNLTSSLEKLSSGLKINKAADDASGMAIADKLRTQASSLGQGISNANSATALIQIADKAMSEQSNILDTVKTKLIQASTSTTSEEGREAIRKDIQKLLTQMDNISEQTTYNGINLLNTKGAEFEFQVGEDESFDIGMKAEYAVNTSGLGSENVVSTDAESKIGFGTVASTFAIQGKGSQVTVQNANTAALATSQAAGIVINSGTSSTAFDATDGTVNPVQTSFKLEGENITTLQYGAADNTLASVTLTTEDEELIAALDAQVNQDVGLLGVGGLLGGGGSYTWIAGVASATDGTNNVLSFGDEGIDISDLVIANVNIDSALSSNDIIGVATADAEAITVTQLSESQTALAIDAGTLDLGNAQATIDAALTGTLVGTGGQDNDGFRMLGNADASMSVREGTLTVKVDQTTAAVQFAGVMIGDDTVGRSPGDATHHDGEGSYVLNSTNVTMLSMQNTATTSVTMTTDNLETISLMDEAARNNTNLSRVSDGVYVMAGTGGGDNSIEFAGGGVDLKDLTVAGQQMGTESLFVQTDEAVSVTKLGDEFAQNINLQAGNSAGDGSHGATAATEWLMGVTTDTEVLQGSLSELLKLDKNGLTADVANQMMSVVDTAMTQLNSVRSDFGSTQNQLDVATRNMMVTQVNVKNAESVIRDVDYAAESANFNKQNIIAQAGTYAMSQSNAMQQNVLRLLQ